MGLVQGRRRNIYTFMVLVHYFLVVVVVVGAGSCGHRLGVVVGLNLWQREAKACVSLLAAGLIKSFAHV